MTLKLILTNENSEVLDEFQLDLWNIDIFDAAAKCTSEDIAGIIHEALDRVNKQIEEDVEELGINNTLVKSAEERPK